MKAEPSKNKSESNSYSDNDSQSELICKKCKQGEMLPAIEEGDPEYTDNFICSNCHHRDTIPTRDLLFSQIVTALTGIGICLYLFSRQLFILLKGIQNSTLDTPYIDGALLLTAGVFLSGFIFVLLKAREAFKHRKQYKRIKNPDVPNL